MGKVALLCDDTGIPQTAEKRLEVFGRIMEKAKSTISIRAGSILIR